MSSINYNHTRPGRPLGEFLPLQDLALTEGPNEESPLAEMMSKLATSSRLPFMAPYLHSLGNKFMPYLFFSRKVPGTREVKTDKSEEEGCLSFSILSEDDQTC